MNKQSARETYLATAPEAGMSRRRFLLGTAGFAGLLAAAQLTAACAPTGGAPGAAPAADAGAAAGSGTGGRLIFAAETIGDSLEPGVWTGFGTINIVDNLAGYLTRPNSENKFVGAAEPFVAESWTISDDGKTYTFKIRPGIKFHDGTDLDAAAVVRSLTRQVNPEDPSYVEGLYMHSAYTKNRKSIEAPDAETVVIELTDPDVTYLYRLYHPSAVLLSPKSLDELGSKINTNLVSCGPFKLDRFTPGAEARLIANEAFFEGRPPLDEIVLRGYPDEGAMLAAIESGEVNFAPYPPSSAIPRLSETEGVTVLPGEPVISLFLSNCMLNAPTDNHDVRMAINYAVSRDNLIEAVLYGLGQQPATLISPVELGYNPAGEAVSSQDVEKAKEHIALSGLPTPIALTLSFENNRFWPQMAELVKSDLEAIGFAITLDPQDAGAYWDKVFGGKVQLGMNQRSLWSPDPDDKVVLLLSSESTAQMETGIVSALPDYSAKMDELIIAGRSEYDSETRIPIYEEIQTMLLEEMPYVMLAYYKKPAVLAANVKGVPVGGTSNERIFVQSVSVE
jgi:peptide/nickel transport system substrate-binding protein